MRFGIGRMMLAAALLAAPAVPLPAAETTTTGQPGATAAPALRLDPAAVALLKAMSDRLAAAHSMSFTAIATYESPALITHQPLAYTTLSQVTLQRPDKLRVITPGDGAPSAFYYDGKQMMAYAPDSGLVAIADAPPTIDAMLQQADRVAALYFPFTDVIVANPYQDVAGEIRLAYVIGRSHVIGDTETDMVGVVTDALQAQVWIGTADHLPRMIRATFFGEPGQFRHQVEFRDWQLDPTLAPDLFWSAKAAAAKRIEFANLDMNIPSVPGH